MSTKKTRSTSANKESKLSLKSVSTQTECESVEVLNYKRKIDILVREVELLKGEVAEFKKKDRLLKSNDVPKNTSVGKPNISSNSAVNISSLIQDHSQEKHERYTDAECSTKSVKGCSCKGNCGSKICGCVKKGLFCFGSCKCSIKQCKNQELSKENTDKEALSLTSEKTLERLSYLTLNQETAHESGKKSRRAVLSQLELQNGTPTQEKVSLRNTGSGVQRQLLFAQDSDDEHDGAIDLKYNQSQASTALTTHCSEKVRINSVLPDSQDPKSSFDSNQTDPKNEIHDEHIVKRRYAIRKIKERSDSSLALSVDPISQNEKSANLTSTEGSILTKTYQNLLDPSSLTENVKSEIHSKENEAIMGGAQYMQEQNYSSSESNSSAGSNSSAQDNLEYSFNPMVPKRQLPRSPINTEGIVITTTTQNKRFSPPKKELAVAEVDWDQHKSELVQCVICKRRFFPHRIEKHVFSCKGI